MQPSRPDRLKKPTHYVRGVILLFTVIFVASVKYPASVDPAQLKMALGLADNQSPNRKPRDRRPDAASVEYLRSGLGLLTAAVVEKPGWDQPGQTGRVLHTDVALHGSPESDTAKLGRRYESVMG